MWTFHLSELGGTTSTATPPPPPAYRYVYVLCAEKQMEFVILNK